MDVYQRFFDGHPELLCPHGHSHHVTIGHDDPDSFEDQVLYSSEEISDNELDMEMEMVLDSPPLLIRRARAMADERQMVPRWVFFFFCFLRLSVLYVRNVLHIFFCSYLVLLPSAMKKVTFFFGSKFKFQGKDGGAFIGTPIPTFPAECAF